jgi:hypothetical protein
MLIQEKFCTWITFSRFLVSHAAKAHAAGRSSESARRIADKLLQGIPVEIINAAVSKLGLTEADDDQVEGETCLAP